MSSFLRRGRSLLCAVDVDEAGTVRVSTARGAHLTSEAVFEALKQRDESRNMTAKNKQKDPEERAYNEPVHDIRRLVSLAPRRAIQREQLRASRSIRRELRKRFAQKQ